MKAVLEKLIVKLDFTHYPARYTCKGENISPPIRIEGLDHPYMAMILDDPDAPRGLFVHWVIYNIPGAGLIPENISKEDMPLELPGAVQGRNSGGTIGYMGPCPPAGSPHRYYLKVYGLEEPLDLGPGANKRELEEAMRGRVRQYGEFMATFKI